MINKTRLSIGWLFFAALFFAGCESDENIVPEEPNEWPVGQNIYVAGSDIVGRHSAAGLWKNGKVERLTGTSGPVSHSSHILSSIALSVSVSDNDDVYVVGNDAIVTGDNWIIDGDDIMTHGDEIIPRARFWKNGEIQTLPGGSDTDQFLSVFVSGDDVYILGYEELMLRPREESRTLKVWKNGEVVISPEEDSQKFVPLFFQLSARPLFVSDGDVYVAGTRVTRSGRRAAIWKNGAAEDLTCEFADSYANSVFVSGEDVYVVGCGYYLPNSTNFSVAAVWKNGKVETLTNGPENGVAFSVCVSEGDVYVVGSENYEGRLWKNGIVQEITDDENAKMYTSVFVSGEDVYMLGYVEKRKYQNDGSWSGYLQASLWKNGKKLNLDFKSEENSDAFHIFVK